MDAGWMAGFTVANTTVLGGASIYLIGGLSALAVLLLVVGLQRAISGRTQVIAQRLDNLGVIEAAPTTGRLGGLSLRGRSGARRTPNAMGTSSQSSYSKQLARDLAQADLKITVGEFLVIAGILASVGGLLGFAIPVGGHVILGVVLLLAGFYGPRIFVTRKKRARLRAFNDQLADMIGLMSSALRSGYGLLQAMELAAREGPSPAAPEFERVIREIGLGLSPEEAFSHLVVRTDSEDLVLMVTALNVQREVGGNLVEVLDTISSTIRERIKLLGEVRVLTSQQQFSGYMIALLPVGLAILLAIINPNYMLGVFRTTTWCGWTMLGCSASMIFVGFLIIKRIVDIKV